MVEDNTHRGSRRRQFLKLAGSAPLAGALAGCTSAGGGEAGYPDGDVELVVPYATGGGHDAYARLSKPYWERYLPNEPTVSVRNVTGGGGVTGIRSVDESDPDGHTFMLANIYGMITRQVGRETEYDTREMSHIGALTQAPNALVTMKSAEVAGWDDLVDRIGELSFATNGIGQIGHTGVMLLGELTGLFSASEANFVHYQGTGPALAGLERGEAQVFLVGDATSALKVVSALDAELFTVFDPPNAGETVRSRFTEPATHLSSRLDIEKIQQYAELTVFRRFFTGPPGVPEDALEIQRDAFGKIADDDQFRSEASEANRPIIDPGNAAVLAEQIDKQFDTWTEEPYRTILSNAFE